MKKIITLAICLLACFSLAACQNDDKESSIDSSSEISSTTDNNSENAEKEFDIPKIIDEISSKFTLNNVTRLDDAMFLDVMYGIQAEDVKQFGMMINETGISADEIIIIEGVDSDAAARIFEKISNWYTSKGVQMKDYIPEEYEKIEKCQVHKNENVVYMIVLDNHKEVEELVESYL